MGQQTKIEWCDHTANLWWGCVSVSEGCANCYAETLSKRWGNDVWGNDKPRKEIKSVWNDLIKYQRLAQKANEMRTVFVGSMMDIFEKPMPLVNSKGDSFHSLTQDGMVEATTGVFREIFFRRISDGLYPNLMFLLLTKRPSNINKYIPENWKENPPANVMFGTSIVDMDSLLTLGTQLMKVNGKKFFSFEPQLNWLYLKGTVQNNDNKPEIFDFSSIDWVIQGGESGHGKRPFNLDWARSMRDRCEAAGIPYFFKQIDKVQPIPEDLMIRQYPV